MTDLGSWKFNLVISIGSAESYQMPKNWEDLQTPSKSLCNSRFIFEWEAMESMFAWWTSYFKDI